MVDPNPLEYLREKKILIFCNEKHNMIELFMIVICTILGGVGGALFDSGFSPSCWYGLLFGICITVGVPLFGMFGIFDD